MSQFYPPILPSPSEEYFLIRGGHFHLRYDIYYLKDYWPAENPSYDPAIHHSLTIEKKLIFSTYRKKKFIEYWSYLQLAKG